MEEPLRILIIEDLSSDIELIERELRKLNRPFRTHIVKNEADLKSALNEFKPHLVLSDYLMPGFNGLEALRIVQDFDPALPFIIVTGSTNELTAVEIMKAGAWDYVIKEKLTKLVPAVKGALEKEHLVQENKMTQQALKESAERFQALVESAPVGIVAYDEHGKIIYTNPILIQLMGAKSKDELIGRSAIEFIHSEDQELAKSRIRRNIAGEILEPAVEKIVRPDGKIIIAEINARPIFLNGKRAVIAFITDITQREQEEKLLQIQSAALNAAANAIVITDIDGKIQWVNPAFSELTGYSLKEVVGKNPRILKSGKHDRSFYENLWQTILAGHVWHNELINKRKDGTLYAEEMTITPVVDETGRITNFVGIKQNVTERKQAAERFKNLIEQSNDAIYLLYKNKFELVNRRFTEMFGYTLEECNRPDFNFMNLVASESRPLILQRMKDVEQGKPVPEVYEFTAISKSGKRIICEASISYLQYKDGIASQGIIRDITERRKSEEEIRKLSEALKQSPVAVIIINKNLYIEYVNPAFSKNYGYTESEVLGKKPFEFIFRDDSRHLIQEIKKFIQKQEVWRNELQIKKKDNSLAFAKLMLAPIHDNENQLTHYLILIEDVTEKRRLQEQFLQAQKMEAVGRLAGGIAHDFNNLLTVINGYSELLLKMAGSSHPWFDKIAQIKKAGERASALTSQLLAFSRKQIIQPKLLNLNHVLHELEKMLKRLIGEDIELQIFYDEHLGTIKADPTQIEQVIMNLIVNARDAMPKGGKLTIELKNQLVDSTFINKHAGIKEGWYVKMSVIDTGIGMDQETIKHIFEPFFSTKEKGKGTGLGLATVYGIVKQNKGYIQVYSEVGHGTVFHVYFPIVNASELDASAPETPHKNLIGTETILIVEDEESVRNFIITTLKEFGYNVLYAGNISDALELFKNRLNEIDLVLTDVIMPGGSGADLSAELHKIKPDIKIIFMSGYMDDSIVRHGILPENTHFIQKPFSMVDLAIKIREVLKEEA